MKTFFVCLVTTIFCCLVAEGRFGRFGQRRRSLFDDDDFFKPWSTFDMLSRDFDDPFGDDPFFDHDDFESFFDHSPLRLHSKSEDKPKKDAGKGVCGSKCQHDKKLVIPKLSSRVVLNSDKEFKFAMNVKGFSKKDISVKVQDDFLKISGRKSCKKDAEKCPERSFFRYQYLLPKHADVSKVKARFSKDGFLIVEMPKLPELDEASGSLQIEEIDEEYLPKLKNEMKSKSGKSVKKDEGNKENEKKEEPKKETKFEDEATVEVLP